MQVVLDIVEKYFIIYNLQSQMNVFAYKKLT